MIEPIPLSRLARAANGDWLGDDVAFTGVAIDSRVVKPGDLFVAIPGARVDGHRFIEQAAALGAVAALVQQPVMTAACPSLRVTDTVVALGTLGQLLRDDYDGVLVGVTGSAGKTTAKNLLAAVLSEAGPTAATEGNRNNELGVPLTLAGLTSQTEFAVVEMGAAKPNDIRYLCDIARPSVSVLLNAGSAHLEAYPDRAAIADTKGQIVDGMDADELAVINADQPWSAGWLERAHPARCVTFGCAAQADFRAVDIQEKGFNGVSFTLQHGAHRRRLDVAIPGMAGVYNALAAVAVATELGLSDQAIRRGLGKVKPAPGRGRVHVGHRGACIVDDSYNANPEAVMAALQVLAKSKGRKVLVLGAMRELGPDSAALHREVAAFAASIGVERLFTVGHEAKVAGEVFDGPWQHHDTAAALVEALPEFAADHTVLIKGSRSVGLEAVVAALSAAVGDIAC